MKRVCIIVDHPLRDLEGAVLLGSELARRGTEVFLVPMYQRHEVLLLRPDIVLVNYVRFANVEFITTCKRLGIAVGVVDTEGGVLKDLEAFAVRICPHLGQVDLYCTWGWRQAQALRQCAGPNGQSVVATGCPRYDFAVPPWTAAVREVGPEYNRIILVDMNFPVVNPRFQSSKVESRQLVSGFGLDPAYVEELVRQTRDAQRQIVRIVHHLAARDPNHTVVVRPHPFEDRRTYETTFKSRRNVRVIQEGTIFEWVRKASVVVHNNCSTAIEAFLTGREPIHLAWIDAPLLAQPIAQSVSQHATSVAELEKMIDACLRGEPLPAGSEIRESRRRIIQEFFVANDGRSSVRVADAVMAVLSRGQKAPSRRVSVRDVLTAHRSWPKRLQVALLLLAGHRGFHAVRRLVRARYRTAGKGFGVGEVQEILARLRRASGHFGWVHAGASVTAAALRILGSPSAVRIGAQETVTNSDR